MVVVEVEGRCVVFEERVAVKVWIRTEVKVRWHLGYKAWVAAWVSLASVVNGASVEMTGGADSNGDMVGLELMDLNLDEAEDVWADGVLARLRPEERLE